MFTSKEIRGIARDKLSGRWLVSILVSLTAFLLSGDWDFGGGFQYTLRLENLDIRSLEEAARLVLRHGNFMPPRAAFWGLVGLLFFLLGSAADLGRRNYYIRLCKEEGAGFSDLFSRFEILLKALGLRLYMGLFIFLWSLLLGFPGIIAAYRYSMAPYLMAQDENLGIREAVRKSKALMKGNKGRLFGLHLSFIGWGILCCLSLGVGLLWLNPYIAASEAAFYLTVSGQQIPIRQDPLR